MRYRLLLFLLICACGLVSGSVAGEPGRGEANISAIAPNQVTANNIGEYVAITTDGPQNLSGWKLTDGTHTARLPNKTISGTVAFSDSPRVTELLTEKQTHRWDGHLPLTSDGDTVTLLDANDEPVDAVTYDAKRTDERWHRDTHIRSAAYRPISFSSHQNGTVTPFVLPDSPSVPREALRNATSRIWIGGYELTDPVISDILRERHAAGVDVRVLVDGQPVGGMSEAEFETLATLHADGIPITVLTGSRDRFRFHHPKYAVIDDTALIMTENWKPAGTGGASSRGWGVLVESSGPASDLATLFESDSTARDAVSWTRFEREVDPHPRDNASGIYPTQFNPATVTYDKLRLVLSPTAAERELITAIRSAQDSIVIQQVSVADSDFPLLSEVLAAAKEGVTVKLLLDSEWYVREDNEQLAAELNEKALREEIPIEVRLVEPEDDFGKIHTKGMVIDEEITVIGSMNWNNVSMTENREVMAIIHADSVGSYFAAVFRSDWTRPTTHIPVGLIAATVVIWLVAGMLARYWVTFESDE